MQKILLDTDIGGDIDDAVCLAYLLREPQCALLGVTTVCGESEKRAAAAVFHPELLRFARGFVRVETARRDRMAETAFTPDAGGNVEIARSVDKKNFYALLSSTLNK